MIRYVESAGMFIRKEVRTAGGTSPIRPARNHERQRASASDFVEFSTTGIYAKAFPEIPKSRGNAESVLHISDSKTFRFCNVILLAFLGTKVLRQTPEKWV